MLYNTFNFTVLIGKSNQLKTDFPRLKETWI